jgi:hypothetical protein
MMYVVYIVGHIHHLLNESKKLKFAYNSDRREYIHFDMYFTFFFNKYYQYKLKCKLNTYKKVNTNFPVHGTGFKLVSTVLLFKSQSDVSFIYYNECEF